MSRGIICDYCGDVLVVNALGDDENGETGAWFQIFAVFASFDVCSRSCAVGLIESDEFVTAHDDMTQAITEVAGAVQDGDEP